MIFNKLQRRHYKRSEGIPLSSKMSYRATLKKGRAFLDLLPRKNHKVPTSFLLSGFDNFDKLSYRISHRHASLQLDKSSYQRN